MMRCLPQGALDSGIPGTSRVRFGNEAHVLLCRVLSAGCLVRATRARGKGSLAEARRCVGEFRCPKGRVTPSLDCRFA